MASPSTMIILQSICQEYMPFTEDWHQKIIRIQQLLRQILVACPQHVCQLHSWHFNMDLSEHELKLSTHKMLSFHRMYFIHVNNALVKVVRMYRQFNKIMLLDVKFNGLLLRVSHNVTYKTASCLSKAEATILYIVIVCYNHE